MVLINDWKLTYLFKYILLPNLLIVSKPVLSFLQCFYKNMPNLGAITAVNWLCIEKINGVNPVLSTQSCGQETALNNYSDCDIHGIANPNSANRIHPKCDRNSLSQHIFQ